jgi:hypothetical protein
VQDSVITLSTTSSWFGWLQVRIPESNTTCQEDITLLQQQSEIPGEDERVAH